MSRPGRSCLRVYQTSTYVQDGLGKHKGFDYARTRNPTRDAFERNVAALEGAQHGLAFASGLAATDARVEAAVGRGPRGLRGKPLRRYAPLDVASVRAPGVGIHVRGYALDRRHRGRTNARHPHDLRRNADESHDEIDRSRGGVRARQRPRSHQCGGQHVCNPVFPAPRSRRCGRRAAFDHEILEWAQRHDRRRSRHRSRRPRRRARFPTKRDWRRSRTNGLLARAPWYQDPGRPNEAA